MTQHTDIKAIDTELFRALMRRIASSVAVITTSYEGHIHGMTATAIASVSANPARLLIVVNRSTRSHPLIASSRAFSVNILAETQRDLGTRFSSSSIEDQFAGVDFEIGVSGSPVLKGAAAHLECHLVSETDMGSHTIFVGEIIGGALSPTTNPLLYHDGAYKRLTPRVSPYDIAPFFLERWSPRAFTDETISPSDLMALFEAARWAPSSMNGQPWRFVYVLRDCAGWNQVLESLSNTNRSWAFRAAALVAFVSQDWMDFGSGPVPSPTHSFDAGAAWMSFALQAYLSGWHTHGMAGFDEAKLRETLQIREGFALNAIIAIGKLGDAGMLTDKLRPREMPVDRAPLEQLVFQGNM